jgi:membrane-bound metal-dependent hydrolase YbcI (DUF457 family)
MIWLSMAYHKGRKDLGSIRMIEGASLHILISSLPTGYYMLVAAHLFSGLILGLVLSRFNRRLFIPALLGAILPDLIDKPVGLIVFSETVSYGRLFTHGLWLALFGLILGIVVVRSHPAVLGLSLGICLHQVLDAMWCEPVNWLYPLLGPYIKKQYENFWFEAFLRELTNPFEWIFLITIAVIFVYLYRESFRRHIRAIRARFPL